MNSSLAYIRQSLLKRSISMGIAAGLLLFVLSQTAGLLHAEVHHFHEHTTTCDVFDNLGQPLDSVADYAPAIEKPARWLHANVRLFSVFPAHAVSPYFGRAPPIT